MEDDVFFVFFFFLMVSIILIALLLELSQNSLGWKGLPHRTLHLALSNLIKLTWAHFSKLSTCPWMASLPPAMSTAPPSLASSANMLRVHSTSELIPRAFQVLRLLRISCDDMDQPQCHSTQQAHGRSQCCQLGSS